MTNFGNNEFRNQLKQKMSDTKKALNLKNDLLIEKFKIDNIKLLEINKKKVMTKKS